MAPSFNHSCAAFLRPAVQLHCVYSPLIVAPGHLQGQGSMLMSSSNVTVDRLNLIFHPFVDQWPQLPPGIIRDLRSPDPARSKHVGCFFFFLFYTPPGQRTYRPRSSRAAHLFRSTCLGSEFICQLLSGTLSTCPEKKNHHSENVTCVEWQKWLADGGEMYP